MRLHEALDPTTSSERLRALALDPEVAVRRAVAAHPNAPPEVLWALGEVFPGAVAANPGLLALASGSPAEVRRIPAPTLRMLLTIDPLPEPLWSIFAEHEDQWLRREVLAHPRIPTSILRTIERGGSTRERAAIARNPGAPGDLLTALARDEDRWIRAAVAENRRAPPAVLEALAEDPADAVRAQVAANPSAPVRALTRLLDDRDLHVFVSAATHPSLPTERIEALARRGQPHVRTLLAANPSTPPEVLARLVDDLYGVAAENIARHPSTPTKTLWALARGGSEGVLEALGARADAPRELLVAIHRRRGDAADPCAGLVRFTAPDDARCVHVGRNFRVLRFDHEGGPRCLKAAIGATSMGLFEAERLGGWVSTSWDLRCTLGAPRGVAWLSPRAMLESEAERIAATRGTWNHAVHGLVAAEIEGERAPALLMEWHEGDRLGALAPALQRALLPRMLPSLWRALAAARHGDLHPDNLILSPGRERFHLIDPGALVGHTRREEPGYERRLGFVTNAEHYPILPPYYAPDLRLARGDGLRGHWERYKASVSLSRFAPAIPTAYANVMMRAVDPARGDFTADPLAPIEEPCPADLLALGVLYYRLLTGAPAFPELAAPGWSGLSSIDDRIFGAEGVEAALDRGVLPPRALAADVTAAEERLALALLDLQVPSREALHDLAVAAAASLPASPSR